MTTEDVLFWFAITACLAFIGITLTISLAIRIIAMFNRTTVTYDPTYTLTEAITIPLATANLDNELTQLLRDHT